MIRKNMLVAAVVGVFLLLGCSSSHRSRSTGESAVPSNVSQTKDASLVPPPAGPEAQATYDSPEAAVDALAQAVDTRDRRAVEKHLRPANERVVLGQ